MRTFRQESDSDSSTVEFVTDLLVKYQVDSNAAQEVQTKYEIEWAADENRQSRQ